MKRANKPNTTNSGQRSDSPSSTEWPVPPMGRKHGSALPKKPRGKKRGKVHY